MNLYAQCIADPLEQDPQPILGIFSTYTAHSTPTFPDFLKTINSSQNFNDTATTCYIQHMPELKESYNTLANSTLEDLWEPSSTEEEHQLDSILATIIKELKTENFNLSQTKQLHSDFLTKLLLEESFFAADYYELYQLILEQGQKYQLEEINHIYNLMDLFINVSQGKLNLTTLDPTEKELVFIGLDILHEYHSAISLKLFDKTIHQKYLPRLEEIQKTNPELADKYLDSLYSLNKPLASLPAQPFLQLYLQKYPLSLAIKEVIDKAEAHLTSLKQEQPELVTFSSQATPPFSWLLPPITSNISSTHEEDLLPRKKLRFNE